MVDKDTAKVRIQELQKYLEYHAHRYYVLDDPEIPDDVYDVKYNELVDLETKYSEFITPESITQRVGGAILPGFEKYAHRIKMASLDNAMGQSELFSKYLSKTSGIYPKMAEPKMDGASIEVVYIAGELDVASTRGNGSVGENITHCAKVIKSIPHRLRKSDKYKIPNYLCIRGEAYMSFKDFEAVNVQRVIDGLPPLKNPRNGASGGLRQLDANETAKRMMSVYFYVVAECSEEVAFDFHSDALEALREWGLPVNPRNKLCYNDEEVIAYIEELGIERPDLKYPIDGCVVKVDSLEKQAELGCTSHHPLWGIAYKYEAEKVETPMTGVIFQVGRTGIITPVICVLPVEVGGVTVKRSTLCNIDNIIEKDIHHGDLVILQRAGEVIPQILSARCPEGQERGALVTFPETCPSCGEKIVRLEGEVAHRCVNKNCEAQLVESIQHFASRDALDITGLGESVSEVVVEMGLVDSVADLYKLTYDQWLTLPGFAAGRASNLMDAIAQSKTRELERFIYALGIPNVGKSTARDLVDRFGTMEVLSAATYTQLIEIEGIGEKVASGIVAFFGDAKNIEMLEGLYAHGVRPQSKVKVEAVDNFWKGKTVVVTGGLSSPRPRIEKYIVEMGGKASGSVSKKTDYVIVGNDPGSKYTKAVELGLAILTPDHEEVQKVLAVC